MPDKFILYLIAFIVGVLVLLVIGFVFGIGYRKRVAEREIGSAEDEAKRIINESIKSAEAKKREALVEAREEIILNRAEYEKEEKERRGEIQKQERRLQQKEESIDRKTEGLERRQESLNKKLSNVESEMASVQKLKEEQTAKLEEISGYSTEEAKEYLLQNIETQVTHEIAAKIRETEERLREEADMRAKEIIATAIQRCAVDHSSEITVSVVPLPNDDMKGRIIGREGRNIRSFETLTGCDLIIDDTPEAITISCFDPVRREIAKIALERLIADGRIHPTRIEEMIAKAKKEVAAVIKAEGERAVFETNVEGLSPEIIRLLGRMKYRTSYSQNVLQHSIEVSHIAGLMAAELGTDIHTAKRAGLLHDIGKAIDHEVEGSHVQIGVDIARRYKENAEVLHAIEAHHGDVEPQTVIACLVQAADAISASRPGARRENIENYVRRLEKLEEVPRSFNGVSSCYAIQAGREIRVMVDPENISEDEMVTLARDIAKKIEKELTYPGQVKGHVLRETKAIEYAK